MGKRVMSIWLPQLPLERRARMGDARLSGPFAITREIKNALRLTHINAPAQNAGLRAGQSIPDARAICPELLTELSDPAREDMLLRALRRWADKLSPVVALDAPDGLFLDITGCAHLMGGERDMADYAAERLSDMQFTPRIGIADTKGAAWALAHYGQKAIELVEPASIPNALKSMPVEALRLAPKVSADLRRVGLKTIGQLYPIKSGELARRYGLELPQALSKTLGQTTDPLTPHAIDPVYAARMNLPEAIGLKGDLETVLSRLTESVCKRLTAEMKGARRFTLTVRCVDTGDKHLTIGFARPCFEAGLVRQQFERPLDDLKIEFGADWFRLVAEVIEPVRERQRIIGGEAQERADDLAQVITTLGNRIGFDRVRRFAPGDSHLPEREFTTYEVADQPELEAWPDSIRERPVRVFRPERLSTLEPGRPPKKFQWRREVFDTRCALGPERLTAEWWVDERDYIRDYWVVSTAQGSRLWLMTNPAHKEPNWFVAGRFL